MYRESIKKVSESSTFQGIMLFALLALLYFPTDSIKQQSIPYKQSLGSPSIEEAIEEPPVTKKTRFVETFDKEDNSYPELKEEKKSVSLEQQINLYINEIVSKRYPELDPTTIQAIVYNESRYIPDAVNSSSGTMGLMQISPKWHTQRALDLGVTDLLDPYGNILVGCDILADIAKDTGSIDYALDVFAGGYTYANFYIGAVSPTRVHILETVSKIDSGIIKL